MHCFNQSAENHVAENPIGESKCRLIEYLDCVMRPGSFAGWGELQSLQVEGPERVAIGEGLLNEEAMTPTSPSS